MFVQQLNTKNMKKTLIALFCLSLLGIGKNTFAQDDKKFHFGLAIEPSVNWYSPTEKRDFESAKSPLKFAFGLVTDFALSENIWLSTGIGLGGGGGKINYLENPDDNIGYFLNENDIIEPDGSYAGIDTTSDFISLTSREYKAQYVQIPFTLKMKTKEIGMMTYFGQFGADISVNTRGRADDEGTNLSSTNNTDLTDLNIGNEMQPLLLGLNVGGGAEYNISGSTSLFFSLNYHYGFLNAVKKTSKHLVELDPIAALAGGNATAYTPQKFNPMAISLKIGVLF